MINYIKLGLVGLLIATGLWIHHQHKVIEEMVKEVDNIEVALEVEQINHEAEMFEFEQTTIFDNEKEQNVSEIPTAVGNNTISF